MKCTNCGNKLNSNSVFCPFCGTKARKYQNANRISLKCRYCNGTMEAGEDNSVIECPYCGSKELIFFKEKKEKPSTDEKRSGNGFPVVLLILFAIAFAVTAIGCLTERLYVSGFLAAVQTICFIMAMALRKSNSIKQYIPTVIIALGCILSIPTIASCTYDIEMGNNIADTDWNVIFLSDKVPEPPSKKIDIHYNTDKECRINIHKISQEDYYRYLAECKNMGYTNETSELTHDFTGYDSEGYGLSLSYYSSYKEMRLELTAPTKLSDLNWDAHHICTALPNPPSDSGSFEVEYADYTEVIIGNVTPSDHSSYLAQCKDMGYTIETVSDERSYNAYNPDGYELELSYNSGNKEMKIVLHFPMEFEQIEFPSTGIGSLLPVPKSLSGSVRMMNEWHYSVYIDNMSRADVNEYVDSCIQSGFSKKIYRSDNSFWAENSGDVSIEVLYEGNNVMYIQISGPSDKDYSSLKRD